MATAKSVLDLLTLAIADELGEKAEVAIEFTGKKMELPIKKIMVATGIRNLNLYYEQDSEGNKTEARKLTVEALICAPKTEKGASIADTVDGILTAVMTSDSLSLIKFYTGKASYSTNLGAILQPIYIMVEF